MILREYKTSDCKELMNLFYNTVHKINAKDYTKDQLNVWATGKIELQKWNKSLKEHYSIVAVENEIIVGFGDIVTTGFIDRLYVHKEYQRKGIATAICNQLESSIKGKVVTHSSITAKHFFENRGYKVIKEQNVDIEGIILKNFIMEKSI